MTKFFKKTLRQLSIWTGRTCLFVGSGFISVFILASGYESIYNRSLPLVHTLDKVDLTMLAGVYNLPKAAQLKPSSYGQFGKPVTLKLPSDTRTQRLDIAQPVSDSGEWLARASSLHLLIPSAPLNGNISTLVLYCRASFRTISPQTLPKNDSNVFIDTDQKWRYVYKVLSAKAYATDYPYIPAVRNSKGKLVVFCPDPTNHANDIIEADLLSVQGVEQ